MSFSGIGLAIETEMLKVKDTDAVVGAVYNYDVKIQDGINYPAIIITPIDGDEVMLDSCSDDVSFNFAVRVIDDIQTDFASIEANMRIIADTVLERLKDISTISWSNGSTYKLEFTYQRGFVEEPSPLRVFEVICRFKASESS